MFFVLTHRVVKHSNPGATGFAPRSTNVTSLSVSGPFDRREVAEKATTAALATHTCTEAQVWSAEQITAKLAQGSASMPYDLYNALIKASQLFDRGGEKPVPPKEPAYSPELTKARNSAAAKAMVAANFDCLIFPGTHWNKDGDVWTIRTNHNSGRVGSIRIEFAPNSSEVVCGPEINN